jgi:SAM-dependent methyltransferase
MDVDDRVRDALPVNAPDDAPVAQAYDRWLPPDGAYDDRALHRTAIERGNGPALELGCGNGRLTAWLRHLAPGGTLRVVMGFLVPTSPRTGSGRCGGARRARPTA